MKKFRVRVQFVFDGHFDIMADDPQAARVVAERECGLVMGGSIHTDNDEQVKDWDFSIHPETIILTTKKVRKI